MEDLYFKRQEDVNMFLYDKQRLGVGAEGTCYKIDDYVLKIYHNNIHFNLKNNYDASYYLQFKNINIDSFNFIKNIAYLKKEDSDILIGTISKYIYGSSLEYNTLYNVSIDSIVLGLKTLLPDVAKLSKNGIKIGDTFINNIIYDKNTFKFIDTASYCYSDEEPYYTYKNNVKIIMEELMRSIVGIKNNSLIFEYLINANKEYNYMRDSELLLDPINLLLNLRKSLEEYCDKNISSFSDSKDILTRKLKLY